MRSGYRAKLTNVRRTGEPAASDDASGGSAAGAHGGGGGSASAVEHSSVQPSQQDPTAAQLGAHSHDDPSSNVTRSTRRA